MCCCALYICILFDSHICGFYCCSYGHLAATIALFLYIQNIFYVLFITERIIKIFAFRLKPWTFIFRKLGSKSYLYIYDDFKLTEFYYVCIRTYHLRKSNWNYFGVDVGASAKIFAKMFLKFHLSFAFLKTY